MNTQSSSFGQFSKIAFVIALVVGIGAGYFFMRPKSAAKEATHSASGRGGKSGGGLPDPTVTTAIAQRGDIDISIDALGTVTPQQSVTITSRVQGQITKILYKEGQMVQKGDPLIEIDSRPYQAVLDQAKGQLAKDSATLKGDKIDLERYQSAYESQAISKQQVDDQVQIVKQFEGALIADRGSVESAQANLDYCHIKAPIAGRLGLRLVDEGNMIQTGSTTPLVIIAQLSPITVVFNLAEDDIAKVQSQLIDKASMPVDAYDRSQVKKIADGTFASLDNQVDATTGTVKARADYTNSDLTLFPNEFVNVKMRVKTEHNLLRIPTVAIQKGAQGSFVYLVNDDNIVHVQTIDLGLADSTYTAVTGLHEGEHVATSNFDKLQEKTRVQIRKVEDPTVTDKSVAKEDVK